MKQLIQRTRKAFAIFFVGKRFKKDQWKGLDYYERKAELSFVFDIIFNVSLILGLIVLIVDFLCSC